MNGVHDDNQRQRHERCAEAGGISGRFGYDINEIETYQNNSKACVNPVEWLNAYKQRQDTDQSSQVKYDQQ